MLTTFAVKTGTLHIGPFTTVDEACDYAELHGGHVYGMSRSADTRCTDPVYPELTPPTQGGTQ